MTLLLSKWAYRKKIRKFIFSILLGITMYVLLKLPGIVYAALIYYFFTSTCFYFYFVSDLYLGLESLSIDFNEILAKFLIP